VATRKNMQEKIERAVADCVDSAQAFSMIYYIMFPVRPYNYIDQCDEPLIVPFVREDYLKYIEIDHVMLTVYPSGMVKYGYYT
jgi:hypothetical protein